MAKKEIKIKDNKDSNKMKKIKNQQINKAEQLETNSTKSTKSTKSTISPTQPSSAEIEVGNLLNIVFGKNADKALSGAVDMVDLGDLEDLEDLVHINNFSNIIKQNLPDYLQEAISVAGSEEESDLLLLGSLTALSVCLPNIYGLYGGHKLFPNLFVYITGAASAGKGCLNSCRQLAQPIHDDLHKQFLEAKEQYKIKLRELPLSVNKESVPKPAMKSLFIPANSSSTAVYQMLNDNDGVGLIYETEGDTLANTFKSDYGNFSDGFRKAFHHEPISYLRRAENELVEITHPKLSVLLTGTPNQILSLIPNAENGLFSRFIFYYRKTTTNWVNQFTHGDNTLDSHFECLGNSYYDFYLNLNKSKPIRFSFSKKQEEIFNNLFEKLQNKYFFLYGVDMMASIRRMGVNAFRIAMILTALRHITDDKIPEKMVCIDSDFRTAIIMVLVLIQHAALVFGSLPTNDKTSKLSSFTVIVQSFYDKLPSEFTRKKYVAVASLFNISPKMADKYIIRLCEKGLLKHVYHGTYSKV